MPMYCRHQYVQQATSNLLNLISIDFPIGDIRSSMNTTTSILLKLFYLPGNWIGVSFAINLMITICNARTFHQLLPIGPLTRLILFLRLSSVIRVSPAVVVSLASDLPTKKCHIPNGMFVFMKRFRSTLGLMTLFKCILLLWTHLNWLHGRTNRGLKNLPKKTVICIRSLQTGRVDPATACSRLAVVLSNRFCYEPLMPFTMFHLLGTLVRMKNLLKTLKTPKMPTTSCTKHQNLYKIYLMRCKLKEL